MIGHATGVTVTPAKAGVQKVSRDWIPAFAGMTARAAGQVNKRKSVAQKQQTFTNQLRFDFVYMDLVSFCGSYFRRDNRLGSRYEFAQGTAAGRCRGNNRRAVDVCNAATLTLETEPNG